MAAKWARAICAALIVISCSSAAPPDRNYDSVIRLSNDYIRREFNSDPSGYIVRVHDNVETWIVSYNIRPGELGPEPIVVVDKASGIVVSGCAGGQ